MKIIYTLVCIRLMAIFDSIESSSQRSLIDQRLRPPAMPRRTSEGVRIVMLNNHFCNGLALQNGVVLPISAEEEAQWTAFFRGQELSSQLSRCDAVHRRPPSMPHRTSEGVRLVMVGNGPALRLEDGRNIPLSDEELNQWIAYFSEHDTS